MGSRSRRDPAGHQVRGKGEPTPDAEQNRERQPPQAPPAVFVMVPTGYQGQLGEHPAIGKTLDLTFVGVGDTRCVVRMQPDNWPVLAGAVADLFREAELAPDTPPATKSGIILPAGANPELVEREAKAAAARERAETEMREGK